MLLIITSLECDSNRMRYLSAIIRLLWIESLIYLKTTCALYSVCCLAYMDGWKRNSSEIIHPGRRRRYSCFVTLYIVTPFLFDKRFRIEGRTVMRDMNMTFQAEIVHPDIVVAVRVGTADTKGAGLLEDGMMDGEGDTGGRSVLLKVLLDGSDETVQSGLVREGVMNSLTDFRGKGSQPHWGVRGDIYTVNNKYHIRCDNNPY